MRWNMEELTNKAMHYIFAIDQYKSLSKAAEALYISQPALSRYVQNLEQRTGIRIFNRVGNRFLPTPEGKCLLSYAKQISDIELEMQRELLDLANSNNGLLRLAVPTLRSPYLLPNIIPAFKRRYPNVNVEILELHSKEIELALTEGRVDFAILNSDIKYPHTVSEFIRCDEVLLAVPPNHPFVSLPKVYHDSPYPYLDTAMLENETFILQYEGQRTREIADTIFSAKKIKPNILLVTRSLEAAVQMAAQGCGLCFIGETYIKHIAFETPPVFFSLDEPLAKVRLSLAYLDNSYFPRYFSDFVKIVHKSL